MSEDRMLQDRLQHQAGGFDGLLSLIPAKMYYGEDNTSQWRKKKQTKAEQKAARRAKLDPDSELNRNAKEVMDERAKNKRKLREMEQEEDDDDGEEDDSFAVDGVETEKPGEGLRMKAGESNKKQKRDEDEGNEDDWEDDEEPAKDPESAAEVPQEPQSKLSKKQEKKAAKTQKRKEKRAEKKTKKVDQQDASKTSEGTGQAETPAKSKKDKKTQKEAAPAKETTTKLEDEADEEDMADSKEQGVGFSGTQQDEEGSGPSVAESEPQSPTFDTNIPNGTTADAASASTSVSSTVPPSEKPKHIKIPTDTSHLKARLAARIEALRAARKADGPDGKPIRTRQELIESRRAKEAQRKAHKKELRNQAKIEEDRKREEALASNSPSVMSPAVERADSPGSFAFGRVAFGDGAQLSHDLSYVLNNNKKKGASDPKTALLKVQAQKNRMEELDDEKRKDIAEKELWLNARRRVEGDKIRDDETILKKTIKRKEAAKRKSEKAWKERQKGIANAQKEKQKKREDNIKKRREEKLMGKAGKKKGGAKKKSRPGFEGSLGVGGRRK